MHQSDSSPQVAELLRNLFLAIGFILFVTLTLAVGHVIMATNPAAASAGDMQPELHSLLNKR